MTSGEMVDAALARAEKDLETRSVDELAIPCRDAARDARLGR